MRTCKIKLFVKTRMCLFSNFYAHMFFEYYRYVVISSTKKKTYLYHTYKYFCYIHMLICRLEWFISSFPEKFPEIYKDENGAGISQKISVQRKFFFMFWYCMIQIFPFSPALVIATDKFYEGI